ncbi:hypothetical protein M5689_023595 [Euphorbia peplus]|nr:hypothetical protein M5689_023595 [Euphorbia peplus]
MAVSEPHSKLKTTTTKSGGSSTVPSLPPPCPKSPPPYPDLYGKRKEFAKVQMLEREIGFLEEELKSIERLQPASRFCKEVTDFVVANSDPLIPTNRKNRKSCRFWRWLCGIPCSCFSRICCCGCSGCSLCQKPTNCCDCDLSNCCSCISCPKPNWQCCTCSCSCSCACPKPDCCKKPSCSCGIPKLSCCECGIPKPSCPDCSCCKWKCSAPECPNLSKCFKVCFCCNCTKTCCNLCCLPF